MAWFSEAKRWDVGYFHAVRWSWPDRVLRPIGEGLIRRSDPVLGGADVRSLPIIEKISFGGVLSITEPSERDGYKGRLFWAEPGDLVYSKIRVKQGSLALIPPHLGRVAVSAEYPVFAVRVDHFVPEFLTWVLRSPAFLAMLDGLAHGGSTKTRIHPEDFTALRVPMLPLPAQRAIADHAERAEAAVRRAKERAEALRLGAQAAFLRGLGLDLPEARGRPKTLTLRWSAVERWGVGFNQRMVGGGLALEGTFPVVRLGDVVADLENGWSPKCLPRPAEDDEWGVLKLGAVSFGRYDDAENKALPSRLKPVPALEVRAGDVLISRANIPRLVGASARVEQTRPRLMLCDKVFRVVPLKDPPVDPEFLTEILKISQVRFQIESACTGTSPTMQNITKPALLGLRFPLPPLDIQEALAGEFTASRSAADALVTEARAAHATAMAEVDAMLLGTMTVPAALRTEA